MTEWGPQGIAEVVASAASFISACGAVFYGRRASKRAGAAHDTAANVEEAVNGRNNALLVRTQQLEQSLVEHGAPVPTDPAVQPVNLDEPTQ